MQQQDAKDPTTCLTEAERVGPPRLLLVPFPPKQQARDEMIRGVSDTSKTTLGY